MVPSTYTPLKSSCPVNISFEVRILISLNDIKHTILLMSVTLTFSLTSNTPSRSYHDYISSRISLHLPQWHPTCHLANFKLLSNNHVIHYLLQNLKDSFIHTLTHTFLLSVSVLLQYLTYSTISKEKVCNLINERQDHKWKTEFLLCNSK